MYRQLIRPILFKFSPETAHNLTFKGLGLLRRIPFAGKLMKLIYSHKTPSLSRNVFGINFPSPVGLAAGLDKNGEFYNELSWFGFSFIEIGSLTPEAQPGNPKPRLFRLPQDNAIINRMGINNKGIQNAIRHIQKDPPKTIIAASIAKNSTSASDEDTIADYKKAFSYMYDFVDMFTINVSCPNVHGLQNLQDVSYLSDILDPLLDLRICYDAYKPILVKVSPDIPTEELDEILKYCMQSGIDGIVAGNTTRSRDGLTTNKDRIEKIGQRRALRSSFVREKPRYGQAYSSVHVRKAAGSGCRWNNVAGAGQGNAGRRSESDRDLHRFHLRRTFNSEEDQQIP